MQSSSTIGFVEFIEMKYTKESLCRFLFFSISNVFPLPFHEQRNVGLVRIYQKYCDLPLKYLTMESVFEVLIVGEINNFSSNVRKIMVLPGRIGH